MSTPTSLTGLVRMLNELGESIHRIQALAGSAVEQWDTTMTDVLPDQISVATKARGVTPAFADEAAGILRRDFATIRRQILNVQSSAAVVNLAQDSATEMLRSIAVRVSQASTDDLFTI